MKFCRNVAGGCAVAGAPQDLALTLAQRIGTRIPGFRGQFWIDNFEATKDPAHGIRQLCGRSVFEKIPLCSSVQSSTQITRTRKSGENDDLGLRKPGLDLAGES